MGVCFLRIERYPREKVLLNPRLRLLDFFFAGPVLQGEIRCVMLCVARSGSCNLSHRKQCGIKFHKAQKATRLRQEEEKKSVQVRMSMSVLLNAVGQDEDDLTSST